MLYLIIITLLSCWSTWLPSSPTPTSVLIGARIQTKAQTPCHFCLPIVIGQEEGIVTAILKRIGDGRAVVVDIRGFHPEGAGYSAERWKHAI